MTARASNRDQTALFSLSQIWDTHSRRASLSDALRKMESDDTVGERRNEKGLLGDRAGSPSLDARNVAARMPMISGPIKTVQKCYEAQS